MKDNVLVEKSFAFAVRIVKLYKYISQDKREFVLSKQILRSGTSVGAMVREAQQAESKADFIHKLAIGLKEANETDYWLDLLKETEYLTETEYNTIKEDCIELLKLLTSIIKSTRKNVNN